MLVVSTDVVLVVSGSVLCVVVCDKVLVVSTDVVLVVSGSVLCVVVCDAVLVVPAVVVALVVADVLCVAEIVVDCELTVPEIIRSVNNKIYLRNRAPGLGPSCTRHSFAAPG